MKKIVLVGPPGSGKSTVGRLIAACNSLTYISSGDIARSMNTPPGEMATEPAMREQIKSAINRSSQRGFVLDGFPRTIQQAMLLRHWIGNFDMFCLVVDSNTAISRLSARGRHDDNIDIVLKRLEEYYLVTHQVINAACHGFLDTRAVVLKDIESGTPESIAGRITGCAYEYPTRTQKRD